jgi:hypothetical protein
MFNRKEKLKKLILETLIDSPEIITTYFDTIVSNPKKLKALEKSLDVAKAQRLTREFEHLVDELEGKEIEMENQTTPWFELAICDVPDEERGFPMKMACNSAFLDEIEKSGIPRGPKEQMIQQWLEFSVRTIE